MFCRYLWAVLDRPAAVLEGLGATLAPVETRIAYMMKFRWVFGRLGNLLEASLKHLGSILEASWGSWSRLWMFQKHLENPFGSKSPFKPLPRLIFEGCLQRNQHLGRVLGQLWSVLGSPWSRLGPVLDLFISRLKPFWQELNISNRVKASRSVL